MLELPNADCCLIHNSQDPVNVSEVRSFFLCTGKDDEPREVVVGSNAVGRHLHSAGLELFLLIIVVFLTRVCL